MALKRLIKPLSNVLENGGQKHILGELKVLFILLF